MIKRYDITINGVVESADGNYVLYDDHEAMLEAIGADGVCSERITQQGKAIEQHRAEFEVFCGKHGLSARQDMSTGSGLFNSHVVGRMWKAWKAARGITE